MNKGTSSANALSIEQGRIKEQFQFINRCSEKFCKKRVKSFSKKILLIKGITAQLFWTFYKRRKTFSYVVLHVCLFHPVKSNFIRNCVLTFFAIFLLFGLTPADWEWQSLWKLIWWFSENWNYVDWVFLPPLLSSLLFHICICKSNKGFLYKHNFSNFFLSNPKLPNVETFLWMSAL